ncbi:hypothetical protein NE237_026076 [Protea cynaroides]|uniref:Uncharacterized protein n=1 Tax=Protea cynaroides TaxID=273540 RepID=A0A9Q0H491_9MAGN|nr:hypothetical protein NE237_026076 [Protea cynaroides]
MTYLFRFKHSLDLLNVLKEALWTNLIILKHWSGDQKWSFENFQIWAQIHGLSVETMKPNVAPHLVNRCKQRYESEQAHINSHGCDPLSRCPQTNEQSDPHTSHVLQNPTFINAILQLVPQFSSITIDKPNPMDSSLENQFLQYTDESYETLELHPNKNIGHSDDLAIIAPVSQQFSNEGNVAWPTQNPAKRPHTELVKDDVDDGNYSHFLSEGPMVAGEISPTRHYESHKLELSRCQESLDNSCPE